MFKLLMMKGGGALELFEGDFEKSYSWFLYYSKRLTEGHEEYELSLIEADSQEFIASYSFNTTKYTITDKCKELYESLTEGLPNV